MSRVNRLLACALAPLALAACQPGMSLVSAQLPQTSLASIFVPGLPVVDAPVGQPLVVVADRGRLTDVSVTKDSGHPLHGTISADGHTWTSNESDLEWATTYTIDAAAIDARGESTSLQQSVATMAPDNFARAEFDDVFGNTWGVGMPITVDFDTPIVNKEAVENAMVVRTPDPIEGAWYWTSDTQAVYRPAYYWPGLIPIDVDVDLRGVEVAPGVYGRDDVSDHYETTDSVVLKGDANSLMLDVWVNGQLNNSIPVTMGMDGYETLSGTKVIMSKQRERIMDNSTAGVPSTSSEHYHVKVKYAQRLTMSGEFLHASPWAAASWGNTRTSHGCTSMSEENAQWLFSVTHVGDPVELSGTPLKQQAGNGITVWNMSWKDWVKGSATGAHLTEPLA